MKGRDLNEGDWLSACHPLVDLAAYLENSARAGSDQRSDPQLRSEFNTLVSDL